jgi:hypothetical protein
MTIIRSPRVARDFTIISNKVCLDERLSMRSLGLLVRLLSRPDNWTTNSEKLAREFGVGREQMRATINELAAAGYMSLNRQQDVSGRWSSHWIVFDEPNDAEPKSGEPEPGNPYFGGLGAITRTDLTRTDNKGVSARADVVEDGFLEFWDAWPSTDRKVGKKTCAEKWRKKGLSVKTKEIVSHVESMKATKQWLDGFEPAPLTYLNQERWNDGLPCASSGSSSEKNFI